MTNDKTSVKERLIMFLNSQGISKTKFGDSIGVSNAYVTSIRKSIQPDKLESIALNYPNLNIEWLLTGEGSMLNDEDVTEGVLREGDLGSSTSLLPLIPLEALAGYLTVDNEGVTLADCREQYNIPEFKNKGAEFLIKVSGSSMYPKYSNGDLLACRKIKDIMFFQWGKIYVIDTSQGILVKRVYESNNPEHITLVSDNKEVYPPFDIPKTDIRSLSIVVGVIRIE